MIYLLALLIGVVAGLRALLAPTVISWTAYQGSLHLAGTWLAFLGYRWTPWIFSVAAIAELVTDKLPSTPSRKVPPQFGARVVMGALSGAAVAAATESWAVGLAAGTIGAVIGTFGGAAARTGLARAFNADWPAAVIEDVVAVGLSAIVVLMAGLIQ